MEFPGQGPESNKCTPQLIDHLERHPNVFTDTSGVRRFDLLEQAVERAGPEKVIFGSDGPWLHPGSNSQRCTRWDSLGTKRG